MSNSVVIKLIKSKDGTSIYAEANGNPSKPAVVLIHGIGLSAVAWDAQFSDQSLMKRIFAIRYDLRGHGRSGKPLDRIAWSSERFAEDFAAVTTEFGVKRPILLGWSYGCTPAVDIVNYFGPNYLGGLIYVGGLPFTTGSHIITDWQRNAIRGLLRQPDESYRLSLNEYVKNIFLNPGIVSEEIIKSWVDAMETQSPAVFRMALHRKQDQTKFWSAAGPVVPLLIIHGRADQICDHDAVIEEARRRFRKVDVESWQGVGHVPFLEMKSLFNEVIASWTEKVSLGIPKASL